MKKCFGVICILLCILQWGCGTGDGQTGNVSEEDISGQNMPEQSISASGTGEDPVEIQTVSEDSYVLLPDQFAADEFYIVSENMLNYEDALKEMVLAQPADRERIVVSFCDTFSEELQEAFQYEIEHYQEVDVHFGEYNTGLEWHTLDEFPYEIPSGISNEQSYAINYDSRYQELDLDGDGEMEYLFRVDYRNMGYVYKIVDGEPVLCFWQELDELGLESLYYEGDYYLYMGNALVRCGAGCDLLSKRYENNPTTYTPYFNSLRNTYLEYIMGWIEKGDYTWHEGYRAEGYEGMDFKAYLPEGLENYLPVLRIHSGTSWRFESDKSPYFLERCYLPVEVEGKSYEYLFLRKDTVLGRNNDVVVVVLDPVGDVKYNIACMYSLIYTDEFSLTDEREYINELVATHHLEYYCKIGRMQNDSYDELMAIYQPDRVEYGDVGCHALPGNPIVLFYYGEKGFAIAAVYGEKFEIIYDNEENAGVKFLQSGGILEHTLDEEIGTESYLYYEIYTDVYDVRIVLADSFIRVDEDRDGRFTELDSYYCNGYELDQYTWERWMKLYWYYLED